MELLESYSGDLNDNKQLALSLREDGYLLLRDILDVNKVDSVKRDMMDVLLRYGVIKPDESEPIWSGITPDQFDGPKIYGELAHLKSIETLVQDNKTISFYEKLLNGPVLTFVEKNPRAQPPQHLLYKTTIHQDFFFWRDSSGFFTAWTPVTDIDETVGGLVLASQSHKPEFDINLYKYNPESITRTSIPEERIGDVTWLRSDFHPGDVLIFDCRMMHKALPNTSDKIRLSIDSRHQLESSKISWRSRSTFEQGDFYRDRVVRPAVEAAGLTSEESEELVWELAWMNPIEERIQKFSQKRRNGR